MRRHSLVKEGLEDLLYVEICENQINIIPAGKLILLEEINMELANKKTLLHCSKEKLSDIYDVLVEKPALNLADLPQEETALIIMDMVNGFVREGNLRSLRVKNLIPLITDLAQKCQKKDIVKIAFADSHFENCPEFEAYPKHCVKETSESEIVEEIKAVGNYILITKNSTNGFLEPGFKGWLKENTQITNFIIVGNCTDICIKQFSVILKAYYNMQNIQTRIIVPMNMVDTFDLGLHYAELMNLMALFFMQNNGVEIVSQVK